MEKNNDSTWFAVCMMLVILSEVTMMRGMVR